MGTPPHTAYLSGYVGRTCVLTLPHSSHGVLTAPRTAPYCSSGLRSTVYGLRTGSAKVLSTPVLVLGAMPRDGYKPLTVDEVVHTAVHELKDSSESYDTLSKTLGHLLHEADAKFEFLEEDTKAELRAEYVEGGEDEEAEDGV